jgi:hypothetical protein
MFLRSSRAYFVLVRLEMGRALSISEYSAVQVTDGPRLP